MATYEDFLNRAQNAGLLNQFSQYDLDTAKKNPEFGFSMLSYKQDYANAEDQAGRDAANAAAEKLRTQYGNYTGGFDGSKYYGLGPSPGGYQSQYQSGIDDILGKMQNYGDFSFDVVKPTYNNKYQGQLDDLLDQVLNFKDFSWDKETDPAYSAYAKQYRREGDRATQNALAQAAAMSGGQVSSAAMTAASQAGDYYAGKLSDAIPELIDAAYSRYLGEYNMLTDQLGQTQNMEQMDYSKFLNELGQWNTDRAQSYDQWLAGYDMLSGNLSALQGQDDIAYNRLLDQINFNSNKDALALDETLRQQALAQAQVDAMLQAGAMPSAGLLSQSGYTTEYAQALENYVKQQAVAQASKGSGGSSGGSKTNKPTLTWAQTKKEIEDGNMSPAVLAAYEYYMGEAYDDGKPDNGDSADLEVDMNSVLALGYGPISEDRLSELVDSGEVEEYQDGNKIKFRKTGKKSSSTGGLANILGGFKPLG